jgi:hypothetical protein
MLLDVPMLGPAGSNFIQPIMSQAEDSGIAPKLLGGVVDDPRLDVARVRAELSRIAAWSMLQEPAHHAYGWSHCLTMPQAVMNLAGDVVDARAAVAVAATHVVGFRAALGARDLEPSFDPVRPDVASLVEAVAAGPAHAASYAWFAAAGDGDLEPGLAEAAAAHHDAHFAKYTLACLEAAEADPSERPLYLAAAAFLAGYWSFKGDDGLFATPANDVL